MNHLELATAALPEVRDFLQRHPYALLPIGATEQHGPHLPMATDTLLAQEFVRRMAQKSRGLVLPALPVGYSWTWRDVPGTLTLRLETLMDLIRDVVESLERSGVRALCIVTGHEANRQPLKYTLRERIADHSEVRVLNLFYPGMREILDEAESPAWHDGLIHADEIETSLMLAARGDLVQMERAVRDYPEVPPSYGATRTTMGDLMNTGVFGDATLATQDKGERWLEHTTSQAARLWNQFLEQHRLV